MNDGLDGDPSAYRSLLSALAPLLRAFFARRMAFGSEDVEDIVQETLIAVHTRRASYDRNRAFTPWLFAIARHKMIDHYRRLRRTVAVENLGDMLVAEGFEDACLARMDVDKLLGALPPKQARAIRSTRVEGASVAEAATAAGIGESDLKVSVHRGLKTLAARLARQRT